MKKSIIKLEIITIILLFAFAFSTSSIEANTSGDWDYNVINGNAAITHYGGNDSRVVIPSTLDGYTVTQIGYENVISFDQILYVVPFAENEYVKEIVIPNTVTKLECASLTKCNGLEKVVIPDSVKVVKAGFIEKNSNANYTIPDGLVLMSNGDYREIVEVTTLDGKNMYDMAYEILELVNNERRNAGLSPLQMNSQLTENANYRAAEISLYYSHIRPDGEEFYTALTSIGNYAGENIAVGYTSSQKVMSSWMSSEGHRENILYPNYKSIGIGVYLINGTYYYTQEFTSEVSEENFTKEGQENVNYTIPVSTYDGRLTNVIVEDIPSTLSLLKNEEYEVSRAYVGNTEFHNVKTPITLDSINWKSSNPEIVSVDKDGKIQGKKGGAANITASLGEYNRLCTAIVDVPLERIEIEGKSELDASINTSEKYTIKYYPEDTTSPRKITWLVDNPEILTIDENGNVTPIKTGETNIRAVTMNGKDSEFKISVVKHITGISVESEITIYPDEEININAKVIPEDTTDDKQLSYQSFNPNVATVDSNGKIVPIKIGETFIDITSSNGKFKRCKVNVIKRNISDVNIAKIYPRVHNGSEIKPILSISINNKKLVENEDYTLEYRNNIEIGDAEVIITGIGNYEGERTETFEIVNYLRGDLNEDTFINSTDAAFILDLYKNGGATQRNYDIGDMNSDHFLNSIDAAMILDIFKNGLN